MRFNGNFKRCAKRDKLFVNPYGKHVDRDLRLSCILGVRYLPVKSHDDDAVFILSYIVDIDGKRSANPVLGGDEKVVAPLKG